MSPDASNSARRRRLSSETKTMLSQPSNPPILFTKQSVWIMAGIDAGFQKTLHALRSLRCTVCKERWHTAKRCANKCCRLRVSLWNVCGSSRYSSATKTYKQEGGRRANQKRIVFVCHTSRFRTYATHARGILTTTIRSSYE